MIKVLFFGAVVDKIGKRSAGAQAGLSLAELIEQLQCADIQHLLVVVGKDMRLRNIEGWNGT